MAVPARTGMAGLGCGSCSLGSVFPVAAGSAEAAAWPSAAPFCGPGQLAWAAVRPAFWLPATSARVPVMVLGAVPAVADAAWGCAGA